MATTFYWVMIIVLSTFHLILTILPWGNCYLLPPFYRWENWDSASYTGRKWQSQELNPGRLGWKANAARKLTHVGFLRETGRKILLILISVALKLLSNAKQIQASQGTPSMALCPSLTSLFNPILCYSVSSQHLFTFPLSSPKSKITDSICFVPHH